MGPNDTRIRVLFYDDETIRFRIYVSPIVIEEAFLPGSRKDFSIIKIAPKEVSPNGRAVE